MAAFVILHASEAEMLVAGILCHIIRPTSVML